MAKCEILKIIEYSKDYLKEKGFTGIEIILKINNQLLKHLSIFCKG
jgi:hypothetical protein